MNIEELIRAWKADEDDQDTHFAANPIGEELTDQDLLEITGGALPQCPGRIPDCTRFTN
jgi:hypothetical protein